jgi:pimeloyl-ACP methyl ester carboxylesterase
MSTDDIADANTVVLIHGLWMTPRSWEHWIPHYERRGYRVIAPAYPGFEVEVEALRADPTPIESVTVAGTLEHLEGIITALDDPPILIGHSFGGALVQVLLDRGLGAAGIAINSVPTEGVRTRPGSQIRATFPVLHNPANRHRAVGLTPKQFHYAFTNTLSEDESAAAYERYHVPAPGRWVWDGVLDNVKPGHQATWVNYRNGARAAAVHRRRQGPPHAGRGQQAERGPLREVRRPHRLQGVRGPRPLHPRRAPLGEGGRLRPHVGDRARTLEPAGDRAAPSRGRLRGYRLPRLRRLEARSVG